MLPPDTDDEIEAFRLERLAAREADREPGDPPEADVRDVSPGSFACHEALHVSSIAGDFVARHLIDHPAILADPAWFREAHRAFEHLSNLYQAIGAAHLGIPGRQAGGGTDSGD